MMLALPLAVALGLVSCGSKSDEAKAVEEIQNDSIELVQVQHELDSVQAHYDSITGATYESEAAKEEAVKTAQ